ncbi:Leader peptidase (Prepilin peptidase) / N-methyltransferase [hydrothermal vent metagenome]|uniref:Leader peptidase (Prepilin peptidase) / N-methyltransferase n=1 Tax=hydrothermal vent metagenome TaxID=652676 RepID=A0A3B0ZEG0_9ZZZZ
MDVIETLNQTPILVAIVTVVIGLIFGSFLNVVIHRLPKMLMREWSEDCIGFLSEQDKTFSYKQATLANPYNLAVPGSSCPNCDHKITLLENIPVLSYLFLKGRCSQCSIKISPRYPFIELLTSLLTLAVVLQFGLNWQTFFALILTWNLIALSGIDFDHQYLPDNLTLPFIWLGLLLNIFNLYTDINSAVIGAIAGYLSLWTVYQLFKLVTKKEGMGFGDFKLLAVFGAWFGWQSLGVIIILSSIAGAIIGIGLILFKNQSLSKKIPFGPYLAIAGWIFMLWGETINSAYLHYVGLS